MGEGGTEQGEEHFSSMTGGQAFLLLFLFLYVRTTGAPRLVSPNFQLHTIH